jgi:hypothetical protein
LSEYELVFPPYRARYVKLMYILILMLEHV